MQESEKSDTPPPPNWWSIISQKHFDVNCCAHKKCINEIDGVKTSGNSNGVGGGAYEMRSTCINNIFKWIYATFAIALGVMKIARENLAYLRMCVFVAHAVPARCIYDCENNFSHANVYANPKWENKFEELSALNMCALNIFGNCSFLFFFFHCRSTAVVPPPPPPSYFDINLFTNDTCTKINAIKFVCECERKHDRKHGKSAHNQNAYYAWWKALHVIIMNNVS